MSDSTAARVQPLSSMGEARLGFWEMVREVRGICPELSPPNLDWCSLSSEDDELTVSGSRYSIKSSRLRPHSGIKSLAGTTWWGGAEEKWTALFKVGLQELKVRTLDFHFLGKERLDKEWRKAGVDG